MPLQGKRKDRWRGWREVEAKGSWCRGGKDLAQRERVRMVRGMAAEPIQNVYTFYTEEGQKGPNYGRVRRTD
jgi:hypothetical protein